MCARNKIHAFNFMDPPEWKRTGISMFQSTDPGTSYLTNSLVPDVFYGGFCEREGKYEKSSQTAHFTQCVQ
jgi:hypothetical protein